MDAGGRLAQRLSGLAQYFREVPVESARFIKDQEILNDIAGLAREREAAAGELLDAIKQFRRQCPSNL